MFNLGKLFVTVGLIFLGLGILFLLLQRTGLPLGRLPGDIRYRGKNVSLYFPLASSILVSVVLSFIIYVIGKLRH